MARSNRAVKTLLSGPVVMRCSRRAVRIVLCGSGIQVSCGTMWATGMNAQPAVRSPQQPKLGSSAYRISRPQVTQPEQKRRSTESMVGRPEGSLPVVGNVRDHAHLEGNLVNPARHIAQVLRIVVDFGHPHKRAVVRPKTFLALGVVSGRPP